MENLYKNLEVLSLLDGVSGREEKIRNFIIDKLGGSGAELSHRTDRLGNLIVDLKGERRAKSKLMLEAHMDEVGFIVTGITSEGYLRFAPIGGIVPAVVFGRRVSVGGKTGVIAGKAVHQCTAEEKKSVPKLENLLIDMGFFSKEEAESHIKLGDYVVFESDFLELNPDLTGGEGALIKAPALDNRIGCALLLELAMETPKFDITIAFTVQEEVGLRGAKTAAFAIKPDIAVVIDATTAADIAGVEADSRVCEIGGGAVVPFMDGRTLYDSELYRFVRERAEQAGISTQTKTTVAGGTDAGEVQVSGEGVRVVGVSLPCRYLHSGGCVLGKEDINETHHLIKLLSELLPEYKA